MVATPIRMSKSLSEPGNFALLMSLSVGIKRAIRARLAFSPRRTHCASSSLSAIRISLEASLNALKKSFLPLLERTLKNLV